EWSDTLFRRLLTKQMAKEGIHPVLIAIRCKFLNKEAEGSWYQIEITNKSKDTKIRFNVHASHGQDIYTVKLTPGQTRTFRKFYWRQNVLNPNGISQEDDELYDPLLEELLQNRE
ncbi:MAG: hypothetical protein Q8867_09695, partial [Bacteroidota bacterium]|nr:hypothetical protein [Bacteroidota bacterium]